MRSILSRFGNLLARRRGNRLTIWSTLGILLALWVCLLDENSLLNIISAERRISALQSRCARYQAAIHEDSLQLEALRNDRELLEHFAREKYYMRAANEDIFVIETK